MRSNGSSVWWVAALVASWAGGLRAEDQPQWGEKHTRNMVSRETRLPEWFEPGQPDAATGEVDRATTKNVRWVARLGKQTHGTPVIAEGRVLIGTNNEAPRNPRLQGDRCALMCFDEKSGALQWQFNIPKLPDTGDFKYSDWYYIGLCSSPVVENGRVYLATNRCDVVCLDLAGMSNGNDGPFRDEAKYLAGDSGAPIEPGARDADILWVYNMAAELDARPHNAANCSVLLDGDLLYVCTGNGVEWQHLRVAKPAAPSLIALNKKTGKLVAKDDFRIGGDITHGQWSSPGRGVVGGKPMVFFGAGNGFVYGLDALDPTSSPAAPGLLSPVWKFNGQPAAQTQDHVPFEHIHDSHSYEVVANPVFHKNRVYVPITQEGFHGMKLGWLVCLDATKRGDITRTGLLWSRPMGAATATCAIADGLVYQVDYWGTLHCLDAETGRCYWTHTVGQKSPASPLAADGKLFVGAVAPPVAWVFSLGKEKKVLSRIRMRNEIYSSPAAANGTLYIATWRHLFAIQGDAKAPK